MSNLTSSLEFFKTGLWPLIWHYSLAAIIVGGCLAYVILTPARLTPTLKKWLLGLAGIVTYGTVMYGVGVNNGEGTIRAEWTKALQNEINNGTQDRKGADAYIGDGVPSWVCNDAYNRSTAGCK